jgi:hypothetical protein
MPKKADEIAALSEEMLRVLESQRKLGGEAYPPTLRRMAELCGGTHSHDHILKAVGKKAFTARAVVTKKVDRKPSLDSPVYLKEDAPAKKSKRAPSGKNGGSGIAELSMRMLLVLEAQRRLGGEAYPPTLRRLADLCELNGSDTRIPKAISHGTMAERVIVVAKAKGKPNLDAPVLLKEDVEDGASAVLPALLRFALRPVTTSVKGKKVETDAFLTTELKKRFVPALQKPFEDALERRVERQDLPPDVAWVLIKGKPLLFPLENLRPGASRRSLPADGLTAPPSPVPDETSAAPARPTREFAEAFREAFDQLDRRIGSTNFVKLSDLRRDLPEFDRAAFDAGLRQLRIDGQFSLDSHEGLTGPLTPEEREAGVQEAGSLLVYVSRR